MRCNYTISLTSAVNGVGGHRHAPAALPPGKTRYPLYRRRSAPQRKSGQVWKISSPPGFDLRPSSPWRVAISTEISRPTGSTQSNIQCVPGVFSGGRVAGE